MMITKVEDSNLSNQFSSLGLTNNIVKGVLKQGYTIPTQIQEQSIPLALDNRDILATAQTGTGKTAAFVLPILQNLAENPSKKVQIRALVLTPTRELAIQISNFISKYGHFTNLKHVTIYGGVSQHPQVKNLRNGVDIVVATPGRLIDLVNQGHIKLKHVKHFILDEADRMLDMGFLPDIETLITHIPENRQTLLFSATMPDEIIRLTKRIQTDPTMISVDDPSSTVDTIESQLYFVDNGNKFDLLLHLFETQPDIKKALIFCRTKYNCNKLVKKLGKLGFYADKIHGDRSQNQREKVLMAFRNNKIDILVATDVAARGLDIDDITHVINFEITNEPEVYVHRVGRTARAGKDGVAINFASKSEFHLIWNIEIETQEHMVRILEHPFAMTPPQLTDLSANKVNSDNFKGRGKQKRRRGIKNYGKRTSNKVRRKKNKQPKERLVARSKNQ